MTTVLCIPQWQGSGAAGAPRLVSGAHRTAELVPADARVVVPVLEPDGGMREGVRALDILLANLRLTEAALAGIDDVVVTAGGDCGIELGPVAAARARHGDELTVLWIDAHPDVSTPQTLPSGSFHGMVLRTLLGEGAAPLTPAALEGLAGPVYVHVDLDVLDPAEFASTCYPEPDGLPVQRLIDLLSGVHDVAGASITEHAPRDDADHEREADVIARIGSALAAP